MNPPMYNDIFVRDGLSDRGVYPYPDALAASPDIIPYAQTFLPTQQEFAAFLGDAAYAADQGLALSYGAMNYVYLRARNLGTVPSSGSGHVFWATSSLLLMPDQWIQNELQTYGGGPGTLVQGDGTTAIQPGARCIASAPFMFAPTEQAHYCLIGIVVTPSHPNVFPPTPGPSGKLTMEVFCEWVRDNPAVSWRNLAINTDHAVPTQLWAQTFSNPDPAPRSCFFIVTCTAIPAGTTLALSCPEAGPQPAINTTLQVIDPNGILYFGTTLPAQFGPSSLIVTMNLPAGQKLPPDAQVVVAYATGEPEGGPLIRFSTQPEEHGWDGESLAPHGFSADMRIVYLGNFVMRWA